MDVKIVRLMSGEEIIATVVDNTETLSLKDPAVLIPSPEGKLLLARWLPYADQPENGIAIEKKNILFTVEPQEQLKDHYTNVVVNNLVVPAKKIVNPMENSNLKLTV